MAKRLQEINPNHSSENMRKAHKTMKKLGIFIEHQRKAALKCMEKNPNQLRKCLKKAHKLHPLALLALESRRKNYPYEFMDGIFDSNEERIVCRKLVEKRLIDKPIEKVNIHLRIGRCHIDFFIKDKLFLEYHPPRKFGRLIETQDSYYQQRRRLLDNNGFKNYPLIIISSIRDLDKKINEIVEIIHSP